MKLITALTLAFSLNVFAQEVKVDGNDPAQEGTTTIQIKKTKATDDKSVSAERTWEITDGTADVTGETQAMTTEAKASWKKACEDWKKEFRADNKENKIINISCGVPTCDGESAKKTCTSKAEYKIKTKIN